MSVANCLEKIERMNSHLEWLTLIFNKLKIIEMKYIEFVGTSLLYIIC